MNIARIVAAVHDRRGKALAAAAVAILGMVVFSSCAGGARVGDVWGVQHSETISAADQDMFLTDRASRLHFKSVPLPVEEQSQEFLVTWRGAGVRAVRFEYRQVNVPDTIVALTAPALDRHRHTFEIRGEEYAKGGPVSAWRVSLWNGDQLLDEKTSALW